MRLILIAALLMPLHAACAAPPAPTPMAETQSLKDFAAAHKDCQEWSDGCSTCVRKEGGDFACSLPGIACLPQTLACQPPAEMPSPPAPYHAPNPDYPSKPE